MTLISGFWSTTRSSCWRMSNPLRAWRITERRGGHRTERDRDRGDRHHAGRRRRLPADLVSAGRGRTVLARIRLGRHGRDADVALLSFTVTRRWPGRWSLLSRAAVGDHRAVGDTSSACAPGTSTGRCTGDWTMAERSSSSRAVAVLALALIRSGSSASSTSRRSTAVNSI